MALVASLSLPLMVIEGGDDETVTLTVKNTGGTDITFTSIQTYFGSPSTAGYCGQVTFPPGASMTITAGSTNTYNFTISVLAPQVAGASAAPPGQVQIGATIYDATNGASSAPPLTVGIVPAYAWPLSQYPRAPGYLDMSQGLNSINYLIFQ